MSSPRRLNRRLVLLAAALLVGQRGSAMAEPVFPAGSGIGLTPPPGYVIASEHVGFEREDGSAVIVLRSGQLSRTTVARSAVLAELTRMTDRTLAASGVRNLRRRAFDAPGFNGSLATGLTGTGDELESVWFLTFIGDEVSGSVVWRLSGTASPEQVAVVEQTLAGLVTRAPPSAADQLAAWPISFDTSVYRRTGANDAFVSLTNGNLEEIVLFTILPSPAPPVADRTAAARDVLAHPMIRSSVRDPSWESSGPAASQGLAGLDGVRLRAWVTQTPTNQSARMAMRVGFMEDGRRLVALLVVAASPSTLRFIEASQRFDRVADSLTLR